GEVVRNRRVAIEQETRRAVADERARIAREIHDVVAHSVTVIVVQAAAADDVFETRPDQARQALRSIEATGREALGELRHLLSAVRPGDADSPASDDLDDGDRPAGPVGGSGGAAALARPQPGLSRVDELAGPFRAAGLDVTIERVGAVRPLTPGVDVSAYRIVQEALTNTLRHAKAKRVEVTIVFGTDAIALDVV
nr:histidine kinase [Micromonospora sp. DSM 115978]